MGECEAEDNQGVARFPMEKSRVRLPGVDWVLGSSGSQTPVQPTVTREFSRAKGFIIPELATSATSSQSRPVTAVPIAYNYTHSAPAMARHDNERPLPPTAYFRYQGAIVNEMKKRGVQVMLPNASRWISSRWRNEDTQIKTAFWQLAEIREAEDQRKTPEDKALMKRARKKRSFDNSLDVLLEGSTNPDARKLADIISDWVANIPSPSPQELEKQMMPVNLRRKGKNERGSTRFVAEPSETPGSSGIQSTAFPIAQTPPFPIAQTPPFPVAQTPPFPVVQSPSFPIVQSPPFSVVQSPSFPVVQNPPFPVVQSPPPRGGGTPKAEEDKDMDI